MKIPGKLFLLVAMLLPVWAAAQSVTVNFELAGANASSTKVTLLNAEGQPIEGATATLSASHELKTSGAGVGNNVVCPNINGNTSPTIELLLTVNGLPSTMKFGGIGLDIYALNASGAFQSNSDNKSRQFNVDVAVNDAAIGTLDDIDIAAGIGESGNVHKIWEIESDGDFTATSPMTVKITVTKGSVNEGCFFGLGKIVIGEGEGSSPVDPDPDPDPDPDKNALKAGVYNISWKANTSDFMVERADNSLGVAAYSVANSCFWELIPAEGENCFYIRNTVSGRYIATCNRTPASSSTISTTDTPVAYYIGLTSGTASEIAECYYLSSTDCTNYDNEARSPRALNKDGGSSNIIAWQAGANGSTWRVGSYWKIVPATESYEVRPFTPSESAASPAALYQIYSPEAKALSSTLSWGEAAVADKNYQWCFVGSGNATGYQIVNAATGECVGGNDSRYAVFNSDVEGYYRFRPVNKLDDESADLTIDGVKAFRFTAARSSFALAAKIYTMPCGSVGTNWLSQASITGESVVMPMYYPADVVRAKKVATPTVSKPTHWFTLFTTNKATVAPGKATVSLTLRNTPAANLTATLYFDWNGDGYFETSLPLDIAKTMEAEIEIPEGAKTGECRMRLRLNTNGLPGAEDTTDGQVVDFIINVTDRMPEEFDITLLTNSPTRGTATLTPEDVAVATPLGTSTFVCWKEGNQVLSVDSEMKVERTHKRVITAVFSPNLDESVGIDAVQAAPGEIPVLSYDGTVIAAESLSGVNALMVFDLNGSVVASTKSNTLNVSSLPAGIYVAKAFAPSGSAAMKIAVKN